MEQNKLLSIIIPVYNAEKYLDRCLQSVLNQDYKNIEIILIDDGSKDSSPQICDKYKQEHSQIKVFHINNSGASAARNIGIEKANGYWIAFVDSDDFVKHDIYSKLINEANKQNADSVFCDLFYVDSKNKSYIYTLANCFPNNKHKTIIEQFESLDGRVYSAVIKKDVIVKNNIKYPTHIVFAEDFYFIMSVKICSNIIAKVNEPLYYYFIDNQSSIMHIKKERRYWDEQLAYLEVIKMFIDKGLTQEYKKII